MIFTHRFLQPLGRAFYLSCILAWLFAPAGCMPFTPPETEEFTTSATGEGLFVVNQGNFMYANASLSYYNPQTKDIENEVFVRANGINLGDVAQSMVLYKETAYVVVNNSGVVFAIDPKTFTLKGMLTGLVSPRNIHFVNERKAYITDLYAEALAVVDPVTLQITGTIPTPGHTSTEAITAWEHLVFVSCWSYDNTLLIIDTETDRIVDSLKIGNHPNQLLTDAAGSIWCATQEGLYRIDPRDKKALLKIPASPDTFNTYIALNGTQDSLYYVAKDLYVMHIENAVPPSLPLIHGESRLFYGLAVDPTSSHIYLADAQNYVEPGHILRYNPQGELLDVFVTGINPSAFCFK